MMKGALPFSGFTPQTIQFLNDLKENNFRQWFEDHRELYEIELLQPFRALANTLTPPMHAIDSLFEFRPHKMISRIYRDTRFSSDKTPYKIHLGGYINARGKKSEHCGYYVHIEPDNCMLAGGSWCLEPKVLKAVRQSVYDNIDEYREIVEDPAFKQYFPVIGENHLKTAPKGFPKDFEYIDYLKCKDYTCAYMVPDAFFLAPDLLDKVEDVFKQLKRFADFTNFTIDDFE